MMVFMVVCLVAAFQPAMAEEKNEKDKTTKIEEMVVTANRSEIKKEEVPAVIEVIDKLDLDTTVDRNLVRVLKKNSSIDVIDYPGVLSGISIRGFRPEFSGITKHSLVLIDGRPAGATNLATILKDNVERIEILKGPASAVYGAEAMGGVVNIITRKSKGKIKTSLTVGGGSFDTHYESISSGGRITDRFDFDASVSNKNQNDNFKMGNGDERANTSYKERYGNLRLGSSFTDNWRIDVKGDWYGGRDIMTPGAMYNEDKKPSEKDIDRYGGDISLKGKIGSHKPLITLYASHEDTEYTKRYKGKTHYKSSESETEWLGAQIQDCYHFLNHDLTIGADYQDIDVESKSYKGDGSRKAPYRPDSERENIGIFGDVLMTVFSSFTAL
ncbi:MAG: TonB-dependent receptor [Deltaproteobacteria bacterium]|nr:TonB-dependent receptor [Deltaproteobacteria bacterium]